MTGATKTGAAIDRLSEDDIGRLVDDFYGKIRADAELGPIFARAIPGDWGPHLATMRNFWSSVMLTSGRYKGNPVAVHGRVVGIEMELFSAGSRCSMKAAASYSCPTSPMSFIPKPCASLRASSSRCSTGRTGPGRGVVHDNGCAVIGAPCYHLASPLPYCSCPDRWWRPSPGSVQENSSA